MKKLLLVLALLMPFALVAEEEKVLDLRIKGVGYRWVQGLEGMPNGNAMRVFTSIGVTKHVDAKIGWNRMNIDNPLEDGMDNIMFEVYYKF